MKNLFQRLLSDWKTTSGGLLMILGSTIHLVFAVRAHTADENTWTISVTAIIGGIGLIFAGDASKTEKTAAAVDKINVEGPDASAPPLSTKPPTD